MPIPAIKQRMENDSASPTDTRAVGKGLFNVLVINLSKSFSMIWLMITEEPESKNPPKNNMPRTDKSARGDANTKPKAQEKATRKDNRGFNNSQYALVFAITKVKLEMDCVCPVSISVC